MLERNDRAAQPHRFELPRGHIREGFRKGLNEPLNILLSLCERHTWLEPSHSAGPEIAHGGLGSRQPPVR